MTYYHSSSSHNHNGVLESCLNDILSCVKPSENDHLMRVHTINELTAAIRSVGSLKDVVVRPFGSFVSNLYTKWGDLDTSVELSRISPSSVGKKRKQNALRDIMRVLRNNGIAYRFEFIPSARVPLLKFDSNRHDLSCDVSIDNQVGWMKSRILLLISEIDERFRDMVLLTKEWAKAHYINDPKSGTLNSYSLCLMVIFHFQTCEPPILPPLKDIYEGNLFGITGTWSGLERQIEGECAAKIAMFKRFRLINQSTVGQLLVSFFDKFSRIERLSFDYAICTYTGHWESIGSNPRWTDKNHSLRIEDPFERPDNAARAVGPRELSMISQAFMATYQELSSYSVLSDRNALLDLLVRPNIRSCLTGGTKTSYGNKRNQEKPQVRNMVSQMNNASPATIHGGFRGGPVGYHEPSASNRGVSLYQSSPSTVARQRQEHATSGYVQHIWRPRDPYS